MAKEQGADFEKAPRKSSRICRRRPDATENGIDKLKPMWRNESNPPPGFPPGISEKTTTSGIGDMLAKREGKRALEFLDCLLREGEHLANAGAITGCTQANRSQRTKGCSQRLPSRPRPGMRPNKRASRTERRKIPKARLSKACNPAAATTS